MKFFYESLRLQLKKTLRLPMIAVMLMFACGIILLGQVFRENIAMQIGLVYSPDFAWVAERLISYGGDNWQIITFESEDALRQAVQSRRIESGYIFGESSEKIRLYTSTATVSDNISNLLVAAVMLEQEMGKIGAGALAPLLSDASSHSREILAGNIQARAESYLAGGFLMERTIIEHSTDAAPQAGAPQNPLGQQVVRVLTLAAATIIGLFCLPQIKPPHIRKITFAAAAVTAVLIVCGMFAAGCFLIARVLL